MGADGRDPVDAVRSLIFRYAELLDAGRVEEFGALFAHGTLRVADSETEVRGAAALCALMRRMLRFYDGVPATKHVNTNCIVTIGPSAETAEARTVFTVYQALPDFPLQAIVVGRYLDRLRRGAAGWAFEERVIAMDLVGDVSRHLAAPP